MATDTLEPSGGDEGYDIGGEGRLLRWLGSLGSRGVPFDPVQPPAGALSPPVVAPVVGTPPAAVVPQESRDALLARLIPGYGGETSSAAIRMPRAIAPTGSQTINELQKLSAELRGIKSPVLAEQNLEGAFNALNAANPRPTREALQGSWADNARARTDDVNFWANLLPKTGEATAADGLSRAIKGYEANADVRHERDVAANKDTLDRGVQGLGFRKGDTDSKNANAKYGTELQMSKLAAIEKALTGKGQLEHGKDVVAATREKTAADIGMANARLSEDKYKDVRQLKMVMGIQREIEDAAAKGDTGKVNLLRTISQTMWPQKPTPVSDYQKALEESFGKEVATRLEGTQPNPIDLQRLKKGDTRFVVDPTTKRLQWATPDMPK